METKSNKRLYILAAIFFIIVFIGNYTPYFLLNSGKSDLASGKYLDAFRKFNLALRIQPSNRDLRYYFVYTLTHFRSNLKIQKKIFEISEEPTEDSAQMLAESKISEWKYKILSTFGNNYIEHVSYDNKILRWDISTFPLRVYIENTSAKNLPNYYVDEIHKSLSAWKNASGFLSFTFVDNKKYADIVFEFSSNPKNTCIENGCKYVVAYTVPIIKANRLKQMIITVYDKDPNGNYLSTKELHNTVLHELGHAFGIMGHSTKGYDLMYMSTNQNQIKSFDTGNYIYLTSNDINTLKLLYQLVPDITNIPINEVNTDGLIYPPIVMGSTDVVMVRKLLDAQRYVEKAPNIPGGWIDLGIAFAEIGKVDEAKAALNKAIDISKTDDEKALAYYNLAVISMNTKKYKDAKKFAEISKEIAPSSEVNELEAAIREYLNLGVKMPMHNFLMH